MRGDRAEGVKKRIETVATGHVVHSAGAKPPFRDRHGAGTQGIPAAVRFAASSGVHGRDEQAASGGSPREVAGTPRVAGEVQRPLPPPGNMHGMDVWRAAVRLADGGRHPTAHDVGLGESSARAGESAAFPAAEANRLNDRIHLVHTPKHGSWLNVVAELECSALQHQCLDRRIESRALVTSEMAAWAEERNREQTGSTGSSASTTRAPN